MTDYYPLIVRAIAGLERNTGESRRALYERARTALVEQLRDVEPALDQSEITRERLALEEAIRKAEEAETARQSSFDQSGPETEPAWEPQPEFNPQPRHEPRFPVSPPRTEQISARPGPMPRATPVANPAAAEGRRHDRPDRMRSEPAPVRAERTPDWSEAPPPIPAPPPRGRNRPADRRPSLTDQGLKGFRDVMGQPPPRVPEHEVATPSSPPSPESAPVEARDSDSPRPEPERDQTKPKKRARLLGPRAHPPLEPPPGAAVARSLDVTARDMADYSVASPPRVEEPQEEEVRAERPLRSYRGLVRLLVIAAILAGLAGAAAIIYRYPGTLLSLVNPFKESTTPQTSRSPEGAATRANKIPDRVVGPGVSEAARPGTIAGPTAAQRVVLIEDDPANPQGRQYVGSAIWRTELVSPGPGLAPEMAVRADVEIPERRITMAWSIRRNTDQTLPASHTIEIMFNLPADFPHGGISNVPGIMMKQAEATRGTPLAGLAVKVTSGYFLIGLSAVESDLLRNVQLLKERAWFDVPVLYNDNRRAIIAIEKGNAGERAFADAFAAWGR